MKKELVRTPVYTTRELKDSVVARTKIEGCSESNLIARAVTQYLAKVKS